MTISNITIVILGLLVLFGLAVKIILACIASWKSCSDEKIKRNFVESIAKTAVLVVIIIICIAIYLCMRNS